MMRVPLARARARPAVQPLAHAAALLPAGARRAITSSTARPIAHETGLPPNVLKYSMPLANEAAISARRDDRGQRMAVADRLAHRDDVRHHALRLEPQQCGADAAEPDLHLVGDAHAAGGPHVRDTPPRGSRRRQRRSGRRTPRMRLAEERGRPAAAARRIASICARDVLGVCAAGIGIAVPVAAAIDVGHPAHLHTWSGGPLPPGPSNLYGLTSISVVVLPW